MRISRVCIRNYRSIRSLEFCPQDLCALVGENNVGKTNILKALNFLLGESYPSKKGLENSDYYQGDTDNPILIEVEFEDNEHDIRRIWYQTAKPREKETGVEYVNGSIYSLTNEVRERCALVYLDANRDLEYHLGHSKWTLYGRVIRYLSLDFTNNAPAQIQTTVADRFGEAHRLLRTDLYNQFESEFKTAFGDQIRRTNYSVEMEFRTFDPQNYYRSIRALLREEDKLKNTSEAGQGMRNLVLLALFRAYAKVFRGDAIIAIEEPEIYLHPHAQRSLAALFEELAQQGNQIFYSTHSGNFIDTGSFDRICLIEKCHDDSGKLGTHARQVSARELVEVRKELHPTIPITENSLRRKYQGLCRLEHNEAFFAQKIVLVEGDTEEYSIPIFARALGYDFDAYGVSIVNAHGKNNLDQLYQLYNAFGIPIYLIFDSDLGEVQYLDQNEILLRMLGELPMREPPSTVSDRYAILGSNFEEEMQRFLDRDELGKYAEWSKAAKAQLGARAGKGLVARMMAQGMNRDNLIPPFIREIIAAVQHLEAKSAEGASQAGIM